MRTARRRHNCGRGKGLAVTQVTRGSPAYRAGVRIGDRVIRVDGAPVESELDVVYHTAMPAFALEVLRRGDTLALPVERTDASPLGITFAARPVQCCTNKCMFCFVDQMPPGLRASLYVKDEDFRHSFMFGNFVTLTRLTPKDLDTIESMALSPLYISVHATNASVRTALLGNPRAGVILTQLRDLRSRGIAYHTQIVVCPGYNDGAVLSRSLRDLLGLGESLLSVGVVPVGLTRFRSSPLDPVTPRIAEDILDRIDRANDGDRRHHGPPRVCGADELYVKSGRPLPSARHYGDYPQLENGIGLLRQLLAEARRLARTQPSSSRTIRAGCTVVTGESARDTLSRALTILSRAGLLRDVHIVPVANDFLGRSVTVAGLLSARDVIKALHACPEDLPQPVVLPSCMFNTRGHTLDGYSLGRIARRTGRRLAVAANLTELCNQPATQRTPRG